MNEELLLQKEKREEYDQEDWSSESERKGEKRLQNNLTIQTLLLAVQAAASHGEIRAYLRQGAQAAASPPTQPEMRL